ncbi:MAG TPA: hypothetical protein VII13_12365 [Vicinamibacteria bacterium]
MARRRWAIPEGLRVFPDGTWRVGDHHVIHPPSLRYLKQHLVREGTEAFVVDGAQRMPVQVDGPAFGVVSLVIDAEGGRARLVLDDGGVEEIADDTLGMNQQNGRFEATVRDGGFRALLARGPHHALLEHLEQDGGRFFLRVGSRRFAVRA